MLVNILIDEKLLYVGMCIMHHDDELHTAQSGNPVVDYFLLTQFLNENNILIENIGFSIDFIHFLSKITEFEFKIIENVYVLAPVHINTTDDYFNYIISIMN